MDINNFGRFNSDTWGNVGEWVMIVVTIITIVFLYITFREQRITNRTQVKKNDLDFILHLFDKLQSDFEGYLLVEDKKDFFGTTALYKYTKGIANTKNKHDAFHFYKNQLETDNIIYLTYSIDIIADLIKDASFDEQFKMLLTKKLKLFFKLKLEFPLGLLVKSFLLLEEDLAIEIRNFYNKYTDTPITKENLIPTENY
ncbi:hypothetical protein [Pedobacter jejuensis]|uniref:DUF4760 domain-containing protein n=1 Tax=Pedobacter jejuensis TaxID=1268550 RepID=A0A3N0BUK6_9SPHI|nr:hypothetical protein [Pedobacter jejuensis]RNL52560.1 hypothetical protein D7004_13515 [Pedobacter jejuensis]